MITTTNALLLGLFIAFLFFMDRMVFWIFEELESRAAENDLVKNINTGEYIFHMVDHKIIEERARKRKRDFVRRCFKI